MMSIHVRRRGRRRSVRRVVRRRVRRLVCFMARTKRRG